LPVRRALSLCILVAALVAIALAVREIRGPLAGLDIEHFTVDGTPVTSFVDPALAAGPAVVIAHGFAGSRPLMHPIAVTLARAGYHAFVFDFPGHGRHPEPLTGSITDPEGATEVLVRATLEVVAHARRVTDGAPVALIGHSMASDVVVRTGARTDIAATVALSMFSPAVTATHPKRLLVVVGEYEPGALVAEARRVVALTAGLDDPGAVDPGRTYGDPDGPGARRLVIAPGVEHVSILYSKVMLDATVAWLDATFGAEVHATGGDPAPVRDGRGPWIFVLVAAVVALAWPASRALPRVRERPAGEGRPWRSFWPVLIVPAVVTPLVLRVVPTGFLPVLVADYLAAHFAVYGLVTWASMRATSPAEAPTPGSRVHPLALMISAFAVTAYALGGLGAAIHFSFTNFLPGPGRLTLIAAIFAGTLPFFLAADRVTHGPHAARGGAVALRIAFLVSLGIAVALDVERLFFLVLIVPAVIACFLVLGLLSRCAYAATGHPLPGALASAATLSWALGVTFPMLGG